MTTIETDLGELDVDSGVDVARPPDEPKLDRLTEVGTTCVVCLDDHLAANETYMFFMCRHGMHRDCGEQMRVTCKKAAPDGSSWACPQCRSPSIEWVSQNVPRLTPALVGGMDKADVPLRRNGHSVRLYHFECNLAMVETWKRSESLEHRNHLGETAVLFALRHRMDVSAILDRADLTVKNDKGDSPSHLMGADPRMARVGDPSAVGTLGRRPLYYAAVAGTRDGNEAVKIWIERGADPRARDDRRDTALIAAIRRGVHPAEELYVAHDVRDCDGNGPLHLAQQRGMTAVVEELLAVDGIDAEARNSNGASWKKMKRSY